MAGGCLEDLIGKRIKVTKPDGNFFFGILKDITETHAKVEDERKGVIIYVPLATHGFGEAW